MKDAPRPIKETAKPKKVTAQVRHQLRILFKTRIMSGLKFKDFDEMVEMTSQLTEREVTHRNLTAFFRDNEDISLPDVIEKLPEKKKVSEETKLAVARQTLKRYRVGYDQIREAMDEMNERLFWLQQAVIELGADSLTTPTPSAKMKTLRELTHGSTNRQPVDEFGLGLGLDDINLRHQIDGRE